MTNRFSHPYLPNSAPEIKAQMLRYLGIDNVSDIYRQVIPDELLFKDRLRLPEAVRSEFELKRRVMGLLNKNQTTEEFISFLGAGCYKHQIPAVCDEMAMRGEFLTGYCGDTYSDHGKMQAIFEYTSLLGELLDADAVSYTTYDAGQSVSSALRIAARVLKAKGKTAKRALVPASMNPEIFSQAKAYCESELMLEKVAMRKDGLLMDLEDLKARLSKGEVVAILYENPSYLGFFETQGQQIADLAHEAGALCVAVVEPAVMGVMESPLNQGADLICGDIQSLGMHMQFGGGQAGFIACAQDVELLKQFPTYMYGICETEKPGIYGYGRAMNYRCSHGSREKANEFFGTATGLWCITAAVYLASMGPAGMRELGENILVNTNYAIETLKTVPRIKVNPSGSANFQEFVVDFADTGKTVKEVNAALLKEGIFGGKDLSEDFPELGQSALYCVSELTSQSDIERLRDAFLKVSEGRY